MHCKIFLSAFFCIWLQFTGAQTVPGEWREHMPYHEGKKVVIAENRVYCMTPYSLFYYDRTDNSINKISKVQGLTDCEFSNIAYSAKSKSLIIVYSNSNIDVIKNNKITNLPVLKNKITIADKRIHDITIVDDLAYLSCSFGLTVLNLEKLEIKDTYYPSKNGDPNRVNDVCFDDKYIYAATQTGIFKALKNDLYLVNYEKWEQIGPNLNECAGVEAYGNSLYALYSNLDETLADSIMYSVNGVWNSVFKFSTNIHSLSLFNNNLLFAGDWGIYKIEEDHSAHVVSVNLGAQYAIVDEVSTMWIADKTRALLRRNNNGESFEITPNSPFTNSVVKVDVRNGVLWIASGFRPDNYASVYSNLGVESYIANTWTPYGYDRFADFVNMRDIINVIINPKDLQNVCFASWTNGGLIEYNNGNFKMWDSRNSSIQDYQIANFAKVGGLSFDEKGDLWITNSSVERPLSVYMPNNKKESDKWRNFSIGKAGENVKIGNVLATSWGHKWVFLGQSVDICIFNDNGTPLTENDDIEPVEVSLANVKSITKPNVIYSITEDLKQNIWIGTDAGPVYYSSPTDPYNTENPLVGSKVSVQVVKGEEKGAYVLETERINDIAIDGNNRKWMATQNSGAFLFSEDGATQISHFTTDNSPLPSNSIVDIAIDGKSGEVYFATNKGLVSYKGYATTGGAEFGKVYAYPNPVRPDYIGDIIITGLITDANVKITDISGNLVFETNALGGQAIWNGKNLLNKRVNTGVYLIFCSNKDGSKTAVTKLMFIH